MAHVKTDVTGGYGFDAWCDERADQGVREPHHPACGSSERTSSAFGDAAAEHPLPAATQPRADR